MKDVAYIALGSNLGQREVFLAQARRAIAALARTRVLGQTPAEETAPIGPVAQGPFLNQMIAIETELSPQDLLVELKKIETRRGPCPHGALGPSHSRPRHCAVRGAERSRAWAHRAPSGALEQRFLAARARDVEELVR